MIVWGTTKKEKDNGTILFEGEMHACIRYCKGLRSSDFDSICIDQDNGVIEKHIISNGMPAEDFIELLNLQ